MLTMNGKRLINPSNVREGIVCNFFESSSLSLTSWVHCTVCFNCVTRKFQQSFLPFCKRLHKDTFLSGWKGDGGPHSYQPQFFVNIIRTVSTRTLPKRRRDWCEVRVGTTELLSVSTVDAIFSDYPQSSATIPERSQEPPAGAGSCESKQFTGFALC